MRLSFYIMTCLMLSMQANAKGRFYCNGALQSKWAEYFCVGGTFTDSLKLENITFGKCEGSQNDGEDEEVEVVEIQSSTYNPSLAASSTEWKKAFAFELSTKNFGDAVLYIKPETLKNNSSESVARLKVTENGKIKDLRLRCGTSY